VAAQPPDAALVSAMTELNAVERSLTGPRPSAEIEADDRGVTARCGLKRAPTYRTPLCPVAAAHGHLLDWPSAYAAWFCPSSAHDITPFFNSDLEPVRASRAADTRALLGSSTGRKSP
jgi:hypothetical protein